MPEQACFSVNLVKIDMRCGYLWFGDGFLWLFGAQFLHGIVVFLLILCHEHLQRTSCVEQKTAVEATELDYRHYSDMQLKLRLLRLLKLLTAVYKQSAACPASFPTKHLQANDTY